MLFRNSIIVWLKCICNEIRIDIDLENRVITIICVLRKLQSRVTRTKYKVNSMQSVSEYIENFFINTNWIGFVSLRMNFSISIKACVP